MPKYKVILPIEHNQKLYTPGKTLDVDEDTAAPLLATGAVEAMPVKGQAPTDSAV